jgi:hypothetical protein
MDKQITNYKQKMVISHWSFVIGVRGGGETVRRLKRRLKASIPYMHTNSNRLSDIRHSDAFIAVSVHLKKPSGGPKGLIGPPCHGAGGNELC